MLIKSMAFVLRPFLWLLDLLTPVGDLLARVWVGQIFFLDGFLKLQNWQNTVRIFRSDYTFGFLSPELSAALTIGAEIILSILLIIGLGGRIMIMIFFIFAILLAYTYNFIWTPDGSTTINQQIAWGLLLMLLMLHGPGKMSVDHWLHKRHGHHLKSRR